MGFNTVVKQFNAMLDLDFGLFSILSSDIKEHVRHIEKAVSTKEPRYISRVLRALVTTRRKLNHNVLRKAINGYFPVNQTSTAKNEMLQYLDEVRYQINPGVYDIMFHCTALLFKSNNNQECYPSSC